jgi:hypothetical protein
MDLPFGAPAAPQAPNSKLHAPNPQTYSNQVWDRLAILLLHASQIQFAPNVNMLVEAGLEQSGDPPASRVPNFVSRQMSTNVIWRQMSSNVIWRQM